MYVGRNEYRVIGPKVSCDMYHHVRNSLIPEYPYLYNKPISIALTKGQAVLQKMKRRVEWLTTECMYVHDINAILLPYTHIGK